MLTARLKHKVRKTIVNKKYNLDRWTYDPIQKIFEIKRGRQLVKFKKISPVAHRLIVKTYNKFLHNPNRYSISVIFHTFIKKAS